MKTFSGTHVQLKVEAQLYVFNSVDGPDGLPQCSRTSNEQYF